MRVPLRSGVVLIFPMLLNTLYIKGFVMETALKAILYTDAGFDQFGPVKFSGYGIHGYTYTDTPPKKGTGDSKVVPTCNGYEGPLDDKGKKVEGERVTVHNYLDIIGGGVGQHSSGEAELNAFIVALKWLDKNPEIKATQVYCDARFVVQGTNDYMTPWANNNWIRSNGSPPQYVETWKECHSLWNGLSAKMDLSLHWIKGHNGHIGNESADKLATRGKVGVTQNRDLPLMTLVSDASGYWKPKVDIPRILQSPRWYFDTVTTEWVDKDGYTSIYTGCHGPKEKDPELLGKPYSDNYLAVIKIRDVPQVMTLLRDYASNTPSAKGGKIVIGNLDHILSTKEVADFDRYKLNFHRPSSREIYLRNAEKVELLAEMKPQGQGYRMMDTWRLLEKRMAEMRSGSDIYQYTDITDRLYETQGKKAQRKLKAEWTSKVKYIDINALFNLEPAGAPQKPFSKKIRLIFGQDILSRNQLAALSEEVKRVTVVSWRDSDQVARYGTYVEMENGDYGLWSRYEANYILVQPNQP